MLLHAFSKLSTFCGCRSLPGLCLALLAPLPLQAQQELDVAGGKALFERNWVSAPSSTAASDGLGPFYNARSCAACHPGGARGSDWQALTLHIDDPVYGRQLQSRAIAGLAPEAEFSFSYVPASLDLPGAQTYPVERLQIGLDKLRYGELHSAYSARQAPSLYGLGQLARVSDAVLESLADPEDRDADGISGRLGPAAAGSAAGRFGWKAESPELAEQIAKAFSLDIGLSSAAYPSAWGDCTQAQRDCLQQVAGDSTGEAGFELAQPVVQLVLAYIESLSIKERQAVDGGGLELFKATGCASCHVPELEPGLAAFSDLLLHDMGQGLSSGAVSDYPLPSEWRTAPLWNLAKSTRLLHDGRARDPETAILWHGGEAARAREHFRALEMKQKQRLIEFLFTL